MKKNMGTVDRAARIIVALGLVFLAFGTGFASAGLWHWLALAVAGIFTLTAVVGNCPMYSIIGVKTCSTR
ncbi:MAG: DUF2892 domain-containing protein [Pseudorhodobacter sp.]|nr:DUF2892 domain-containing protein [Pseudorhodobacter sp.]